MMLLISHFLQNKFGLVALATLKFANLIICFHLIGFIVLYKKILSSYYLLYLIFTIYNKYKN